MPPSEIPLTLASITFWPFKLPSVDPSSSNSPSISAKTRSKFTKWAQSNAPTLQIPLISPPPSPSPAAVRVFSLLHTYSRTAHLHSSLTINHTFPIPSATLHLSIDPSSIHFLGPILSPSESLRAVFWHFFRALKHESPSTPHRNKDTCGFVGCGGACLSLTNLAERLQFRLDRVFHLASQEMTTHYAAEEHQRNLYHQNAKPPQSSFLKLPEEVLHKIVLFLKPVDCASLGGASRFLAQFLRPIVPGLNLTLFPHQQSALERMQKMETRTHATRDMPLLRRISLEGDALLNVVVVVDLVDGSVYRLGKMPVLKSPLGGLFCDEPGLGKTITALSLVLKTLGQKPKLPEACRHVHWLEWKSGKKLQYFLEKAVGRYQSYGDNVDDKILTRRARLFPYLDSEARRSSSRTVRRTSYFEEKRGLGSVPHLEEDARCHAVYLSHATLIVVPNVLTQHWLSQIRMHVQDEWLRVLHIAKAKDLPNSVEELAGDYDVVLVPFEIIGHLSNEIRGEAPMLMRVHFLRIIVDEGHKLSTGNISHFANACARLRSERKWVMTGTPTPSTVKSDVDHLSSLLMFIRDEAYGFDRKAWQVGIREPFSQYRIESLEELRPLLRELMIRADKSILPAKLHIKNVLLDFTKEAAESYNWLVSLTRRNLITADWFSEKHKESLLNRKNMKEAQAVVRNLRLSSCFGGTQEVSFDERDVIETLDILYDNFREVAKVDKNDRFDDPAMEWPLLSLRDIDDEEVLEKQRALQVRADLFEELVESGSEYLRLTRALQSPVNGKAFVSRIYSGVLHDVAEAFLSRRAQCARCYVFTSLPMVTPCAHLLCDNCVYLDKNKCTAQHCGIPYRLDKDGIPEDLIEIQPSAYSAEGWTADWDKTKSAKMAYLIHRIQNLPMNEEWIPGESSPRMTHPKVIIHSAFTFHLHLAVVELKKSSLKDSYVEMWKNDRELDKELKRIKKASDFAQHSISKFAKDPNKNILLMNTRHGSVGLDLSFVEYIFLIEPVWDASVELQIISRAHRIGSKRDIYVERLVMKDSVEHEMLQELEQDLNTSLPGVALEKAQKDLSRHRTILRNLKPVTFRGERSRDIGSGPRRIAKRQERDPDDVIEVESARRVRFKAG